MATRNSNARTKRTVSNGLRAVSFERRVEKPLAAPRRSSFRCFPTRCPCRVSTSSPQLLCAILRSRRFFFLERRRRSSSEDAIMSPRESREGGRRGALGCTRHAIKLRGARCFDTVVAAHVGNRHPSWRPRGGSARTVNRILPGTLLQNAHLLPRGASFRRSLGFKRWK